MAIHGVNPKCYILALFVRDDGTRFLLGDDPFEFKDKQLHFQPNIMANDVVEVQGNDGYLLAGQVRRPGTQMFDGYVANGTNSKADVEVKRREFLQFFRRSHFYKVIYVFPNGTAIQRKQGFLVDDPTVQELYQQYPEYHVALNFEDVNYYTYEEDDQGHEIYAKEAIVPLAGGGATGGLIWDNYGVVWEDPWSLPLSVSGVQFQILNDNNARAPIENVELLGDTYQQTYSGFQLLKKNGLATDKTDTSFWENISSELTITPLGNGWARITASSNTSDKLARILRTGGFEWEASATYTVILEVKNAPNNGAFSMSQPQNAADPFNSIDGDPLARFNGSDYIRVFKGVTKSNINNTGLRAYFYGSFSNASVDLRLTIISGDHTNDYQYFCDDNWQPYVGGGIPAPNPDYPQDVQVVTGQQTVDMYDKNLYLPITGAHPDHGIGATYDNATGEITLIGTGNDTWSNTFQWSAITLPPGKYTVSLTDTIPLNARMRFLYNDNTYVDGAISSGEKTVAVATANEVKSIRLWFSGTNGVDVNGVKFKIQVEAGEAATDFQLHGRYPINLGKNMLNISDFAMGGMSSGQPSASDYRINNALSPIKVLPSTTYTLSVQLGSTVKGYRVGVHECGEDGTFIRDLGWKQLVPGSYSFTTDSDTYIIKLVGSLSTTSNNVTTGDTENTTSCSTVEEFMRGCKLQFELGSISTSMSDYFTPIELCKIGDYQDYIYKSGDDWYLHKEIGYYRLTGDENWRFHATSGSFYDRDNSYASHGGLVPNNNDVLPNIRSTHFTEGTYNEVFVNPPKDGICVASDNTSNPRIHVSGISTTADFKAMITAKQPVLYFPLATATDTQITDATLVGQLDTLGTMRLYIGENNVLVASAGSNLPATLSFDYYTKFAAIGAEWEEGGTKGATIVDVDAIDNTYPVWELTGPATNPTISVLTTNTVLTYNGTITASQKLVIDMFNKTATLNGTSVIGNISGDFVYMAPGTNRVAYTAGNTDAPDSTIYWQEVVG